MLVQQRLGLSHLCIIQPSPFLLSQERQHWAFVLFTLRTNNCTFFNLSSCKGLQDHTDAHSMHLKASKTSDVQICKIMVLLNRTGAIALCEILKMNPLYLGALMKGKLPWKSALNVCI